MELGVSLERGHASQKIHLRGSGRVAISSRDFTSVRGEMPATIDNLERTEEGQSWKRTVSAGWRDSTQSRPGNGKRNCCAAPGK